MNKNEAQQAMLDGHKVRHYHFDDNEYLYMLNNIVYDEHDRNINNWFVNIIESTDWRFEGWSLKEE